MCDVYRGVTCNCLVVGCRCTDGSRIGTSSTNWCLINTPNTWKVALCYSGCQKRGWALGSDDEVYNQPTCTTVSVPQLCGVGLQGAREVQKVSLACDNIRMGQTGSTPVYCRAGEEKAQGSLKPDACHPFRYLRQGPCPCGLARRQDCGPHYIVRGPRQALAGLDAMASAHRQICRLQTAGTRQCHPCLTAIVCDTLSAADGAPIGAGE
jgi:hypothetical protein